MVSCQSLEKQEGYLIHVDITIFRPNTVMEISGL